MPPRLGPVQFRSTMDARVVAHCGIGSNPWEGLDRQLVSLRSRLTAFNQAMEAGILARGDGLRAKRATQVGPDLLRARGVRSLRTHGNYD